MLILLMLAYSYLIPSLDKILISGFEARDCGPPLSHRTRGFEAGSVSDSAK